MTILANALLLHSEFSGMQYATELLLQAIGDSTTPFIKNNPIEILVSKDYQGRLRSKENFHINKLPFSTSNRFKRIHYENFGMPRYYKKSNFQLFHATSNLLPLLSPKPNVLTIHDLVPVAYPQFVTAETYLYYKSFFSKSVHNADKIIAVSHKVKSDLINRFNIDESKIHVIYHGVEPLFKKVVCDQQLSAVRKKYNLPATFLLFVGNLEPRKNLIRLMQAFAEIKTNHQIDQQLVIVGKKGWKYDAIFNQQKLNQVANDIVFTGYVDRTDLPAIYSLCDLFIFPSLYEGFGLPVIEAMACEAPVLVSNQGALPEITDHIYPFVDAFDVTDISAKILLLLQDKELRKQNIRHGVERASYFTWEKTASQTLAVYNTLIQ